MIAVGILFAVAGVVANASAIVLQAAEARRSPAPDAARFALLARLARRPRWLAGTLLMALSWPLQVLALTWAPITVVQPILSTFQLVLLAFAHFQLGERVGRTELVAVLLIVAGLAAVLTAAPHPHQILAPGAARLLVPLLAVGSATLLAYGMARAHPGARIWLTAGAGLGYAWADFANKLLADQLGSGRLGVAGAWLLGALAFGAIAFVLENSALAQWPAVTVAPVIGALQEPLPVLMALWAGVETWSSRPREIAALIAGLALVAAGAAILGRSPAVANASGEGAAAAVRDGATVARSPRAARHFGGRPSRRSP